jgi:dynamin 1-like protein
LNFSLDLSKIIICGPPTCGKSSIVESLVGFDFLPKCIDLVTTIPIEIKLINDTNENSQPYAKIYSGEGFTDTKYDDFSLLKSKLIEIIDKKSPKYTVYNEPIRMSFHSQFLPELTIVELPGVDENTKSSTTIEMCLNYFKDESSIIIYVINADNESFLKNFSNKCESNLLLNLIKKHDKDFNRTIGVITKVDLLKNKILVNNKDEASIIRNGFIVIKNRIESENLSIQDYSIKEKAYFSTNSYFRTVNLSENFTFECLVDRIKKLLLTNTNTRKKLNLLYKTLKDSLQVSQKELSKFGTEYLNFTHDTKNVYVTSLVNNLCDSIEKVFSGKFLENFENKSIYNIKNMYYEFLEGCKKDKLPGNEIKNEEIIRIIKFNEGDRLSGFPEFEVIHTLLEGHVENLRNQVKYFTNTVNDLVRDCVKEIVYRIFCIFPKLLIKVEELMNSLLDEVKLKIHD